MNPESPLADFTATGYSTGILTPRRENLVYRVDPESEDSPFAPLSEVVLLDNLHDGSIIQIKVVNDLSFRANSDTLTIRIQRMAVPEFTKTDKNGEKSPGSILLSGSENYERQKDDGSWEDCGNAFTELPLCGRIKMKSKKTGTLIAGLLVLAGIILIILGAVMLLCVETKTAIPAALFGGGFGALFYALELYVNKV